MKPCRMDIKILLALKKDVRTYAAGNLIYGVIFDILHVIVEYRLTKKTFHCVVAVLWKKILRKWVSCRMDTEGSLNFNFPVASIKSNYRDIFSFPNKLKLDGSNIGTRLLIKEWKSVRYVNLFEVIRLNVEIFCAFEVRPQTTNILVTRENILHRKRLCLVKMKFRFSSTMLKYFVTSLSF